MVTLWDGLPWADAAQTGVCLIIGFGRRFSWIGE